MAESSSRIVWRNWVGNQSCRPQSFHRPKREEDLIALVRRAGQEGKRIKVVGAGHSWTPLALCDDHLATLDDYARVLHVDAEQRRVKVQAGIRLEALSGAMRSAGLAFPVLGTVKFQSIAGAVSTATHGTGLKFGSVSSLVVELELITASGDVMRCSREENADLFAAARCGLGVLGLISTVTLQCEPAFRLRSVERRADLAATLHDLDRLLESNDHFKLWWFPHTQTCLTFEQNRTADACSRSALQRWWSDIAVRNGLVQPLMLASIAAPRITPAAVRFFTGLTPRRVEFVDHSAEVFYHPTYIRHWETEYSIPREHAAAAVERLTRWVNSHRSLRVNMPVDVRFVRGEDIWLSPASGRDSVYLGVLQHRRLPYEEYFRGFEDLMDEYGGRPHWGKMHTKSAVQLKKLYPRFDDFLSLRERLDPGGMFLNGHLKHVLGAAVSPSQRLEA
jgi:L-gulonolactone oxidase